VRNGAAVASITDEEFGSFYAEKGLQRVTPGAHHR